MIDRDCLQQIRFPPTDEFFGSEIAYVSKSLDKVAIVIAVLVERSELTELEENIIHYIRETDDGFVEIRGDGNTGNMSISTNGEDSGGNFSIFVKNNNKNSIFNIEVLGDFNIDVDNKAFMKVGSEFEIVVEKQSDSDLKTTIKYVRGEGFTYEDEFGNSIFIVESQLNVNTEKFVLNDGDEPMVLGNVLRNDILDALFDLLLNTTVATTIGAQPFINLADYAALKPKTVEILSDFGFIK